MIDTILELNKSIKDMKRTWVFLFVFYEFRYNTNTYMLEAKEKEGINRPCATNLSIRKDFYPLDKPILYTWVQHLKKQGIDISMKRILSLIKLQLRIGNVSIRLKPKWTLGRSMIGRR